MRTQTKARATRRRRLPFTADVRKTWRLVKKAILREPAAYDQSNFFHGAPGTHPTCGSPACLAGWFHAPAPAKFQATDEEETESAFVADELTMIHMGMPEGLISRLVVARGAEWPEPFRSQFPRAQPPAERARIAAKRIDHLLRTGE